MAYNYRQVKDIYDRLYDSGVVTESLPEWAQQMNYATGSENYGAGLEDNFLKRFSVGVDRLLEKTGLPWAGEQLGGYVGDLFGDEKTGREIGRGTARGVLDTLPMLLGGGALPIASKVLTGALAGTNTYEKSGSGTAGVVSGILAGTMPVVGNALETGILRSLGNKTLTGQVLTKTGLETVSRTLPKNIWHGTLAQAGQNLGTGAVGEVGDMVTAGLSDQIDYDFSPTRALLGMTLGNLPYTAYQLTRSGGRAAWGGQAARDMEVKLEGQFKLANAEIERRELETKLKATTPLADIPKIESEVNPKVQAEIARTMEILMARQKILNADPTEDNLAESQKIQFDIEKLELESVEHPVNRKVREDSPRTTVVGRVHFERPETGFRMIKTPDGKVFGYSTLFEPTPVPSKAFPGQFEFQLPDNFSREFADNRPVRPIKKSVSDPNQLELVPNEELADGYFDHVGVLNGVEEQLKLAKTETEFQDAINQINAVRQLNGFSELSANQVRKRQEQFGLTLREALSAENKALNRKLAEINRVRDEELNNVRKAVMVSTGEVLPTTELGLYNGKPLGYQKESAEALPVNTILDDIVDAQIFGRGGESEWNNWKRSVGIEKTGAPIGVELERFKTYLRLRDNKDVPLFGPMSEAEAQNFNEILAKDGIGVKDAKTLIAYADRPYVQNWKQRILMKIAEMSAGGQNSSERAPEVYQPKTQAETELIPKLKLEEGAAGQLKYIVETSDPASPARALAQDWLEQFPELLYRMSSSLNPDAFSSFAHVDKARRDGHVVYGPDMLNGDQGTREFLIIHEIAHTLSLAELDNPTKAGIVEKIDGVRQRLIEALPIKAKASFDKAIKENWLAKYQAGAIEFSTLDSDFAARQVLYAALSNKELVSQSYSSGPVKQFLRSVGGSKTEGLWQKLKRYISALTFNKPDKIKETLLSELMDHNYALISRGEQVASFQNYAERFLEGKSYTFDQAVANSRFALGMVLKAANQKSYRDIVKHGILNDGEKTAAFVKAENKFDQWEQTKGEGYDNFVLAMQELGHAPGKSGVKNLLTDILSGDALARDTFEALPDEAGDYVYAKLKQVKDISETIQNAAKMGEKGLVNLTNTKEIKKTTGKLIKSIDEILETEKLRDQTIAWMQNMQATEPSVFLEQWRDLPETAAVPDRAPVLFGASGAKDVEGGVKGFLKKVSVFLKPPGMYEDPVLKEGFAKGWQMIANAKKWASNAFQSFSIDLAQGGKITHESVKKTVKDLANPKLEKALNGYIYENQIAGKDSGKVDLLPQSDPRIQKHLAGLTPDEVSTVIDLMSKTKMSTQEMHQTSLNALSQVAGLYGTKLLNRLTDLPFKHTTALSTELWATIKDTDWNDPTQAALAQTKFADIQSKLPPDAFANLLKFHQSQLETYKTMEKFYSDNPNWVSGQRTGKFRVKFFKGGKVQVHGVDSRKEANELAGGAHRVTEFWEPAKQGDDELPHLGSDYQGIFERLQQLENNQVDLAQTLGFSPDDVQFLRDSSPSKQFARETEGQGISVPGAPPRGLTRGAEDQPWLRNHLAWLHRNAHYWSRRLFREQIDTYVSHKDIPDEAKALIKQHRDNMLMADPETIKNVNAFARTWYMGANVATAMTNAVQPFTTHVAELTSLTGKPLESYRRVTSALKEVAGWKWKGTNEWSNPEIKKLMDRAVDDGEVGLSAYDNDAVVNEAASKNLMDALNKRRPKTLGQRLQSAGGMYSEAAMWLFTHAEQVNNRAALIAGFKLHREKGLSFDEAYQKAVEFNHSVNFGGGRANRPIGAFSSKSPALRGMAMLGTAMQSYVLGTTFQIAKYLKNGLFRPTGLTPAERHGALKAGVQMLATQLAAAGVVGLPFVSGALAILEKGFGIEANKAIREAVTGLTGDDDLLSEIAMSGAPSMVGWDMQSRFSMGNALPGVSEYNGFQPEALLGPPANLVKDFVLGTTKALTGDVRALRKVTPSAYKKLWDLVGGEGKLRDYKDRPILEPTTGEKAGLILGFNPKRLSDFNAAQRMSELSDKNSNREENDFRYQMAEEVQKGNIGSVKAAIKLRAQEKPDYDVETTIRGIARTIEELEFPRDLRREGSNSGRSKLLSMWNLERSQPTETARYQLRKQVEAQFGLMPTGTSELTVARLMDQLRQQNPGATRSELRRMAERLSGRLERQTLLE